MDKTVIYILTNIPWMRAFAYKNKLTRFYKSVAISSGGKYIKIEAKGKRRNG